MTYLGVSALLEKVLRVAWWFWEAFWNFVLGVLSSGI